MALGVLVQETQRWLSTLQYLALRLKVKKERELKAAIAGSNWGEAVGKAQTILLAHTFQLSSEQNPKSILLVPREIQWS